MQKSISFAWQSLFLCLPTSNCVLAVDAVARWELDHWPTLPGFGHCLGLAFKNSPIVCKSCLDIQEFA